MCGGTDAPFITLVTQLSGDSRTIYQLLKSGMKDRPLLAQSKCPIFSPSELKEHKKNCVKDSVREMCDNLRWLALSPNECRELMERSELMTQSGSAVCFHEGM